VENPEIARPESVAGLEEFFVRLAGEPVARVPRIVATSYPNPFNPATEMRVSLPSELTDGGDRVKVRIYAVNGALVRDLYDGQAAGDFVVRWDGTDNRGSRVASATYYAAVTAGDAKETVKLVLLK
jgi:flagellar hook assembly protein FlgD